VGSAGQSAGEAERPKGRGRVVRAPGSADVLLWVALGVDTLVAIVDAITPVVLFGLLVFGPLVAAFRTRPRTTALVAAYALALAVYEGIPHGFFGSVDHLVRVAAIAATGALAVWGSVQRQRTGRAEQHAALLARAGAMLGASLDYERSLQGVADLAVPAAADRIAIDLVVDGAVRRAAAAGAPSETGADRVAEVVDTGEPVLLPDAVVLPLRAREHTLGALTIGSASAPPVPGSAALEFARELAAECATAVDNARLHRELSASEAALRRSNDQLGAILGGVADGVIARDAAAQVVYANAAAATLLGRPSADALRRTPLRDITRWVRLYDEAGSLIETSDLPGARLLRGEAAPDRLVRVEALDSGRARWVLVKARTVPGPDDELGLVLLIFEDVTERSRRERGERFLAEGSKMLAGSLDYEATLRTISALVVPEFADLCSVDVASPGGQIRNVAATHADPDGTPRPDARRHPPPFAAPGIGEVLKTGRPQLYPTVAAPGITSAMVVPLTARGRTLGALTLATDGSGRTFDADDLALAEELARRCALAVDNARLYGERSHVARTLQGSLVPAQLPRVPGFEVAARFHAAGEDVQVGGDFFDVFETDDGSWAAVIGDVSGKGADAAAVTALARYTVRAVAVHGRRPSTVLRELNDAILRHDLDDRFCTAAFARLRGGEHGARVQVSNGGHPLPVLVSVDGDARSVGRPGTALGIGRAPRLFDREVELRPGDKLVFVTDGVIEARVAGRMLGVDGLERLLADAGELDAVATGERIEAAILGEAEPRDDIAVLVLRAAGAGLPRRGREGLTRTGSLGRERALNLRLPGGPHAPAVARAAVEALPAGSLDAPLAHTARLLASEIVTNSVIHGGTGEDDWIGLDIALSPAGLRVEVTDHGPGFARVPTRPDPDDPGGRGLFLVEELADRWGSADGGTRVWFEVDRAAPTSRA
jgi:serine phosphatase RsbU (regulator of sigma subunit)/PAS domain-containing protein/anti-sigma regulatory factor (Ser/Thr protein kinase)